MALGDSWSRYVPGSYRMSAKKKPVEREKRGRSGRSGRIPFHRFASAGYAALYPLQAAQLSRDARQKARGRIPSDLRAGRVEVDEVERVAGPRQRHQRVRHTGGGKVAVQQLCLLRGGTRVANPRA